MTYNVFSGTLNPTHFTSLHFTGRHIVQTQIVPVGEPTHCHQYYQVCFVMFVMWSNAVTVVLKM